MVDGGRYVGGRDGRCYVIFDDKAISIIEKFNQQMNAIVKGTTQDMKDGQRIISLLTEADDSLSRKCLIDHGTEQPTFWQSFTGIRNARRLGYIRSEEMRKRFVHKILSYIGVVLSAVVLDFMLAHAHAPAFATSLVIGYLAITEFVSILIVSFHRINFLERSKESRI